MIGKLTGAFGGTTREGAVIIDVGGVGYLVHVPAGVLATIKNGELSLFIHTAVREDALDLYGFPTEEELAFFKQLMGVSGIGPKTALGILNVSNIATLKQSIAHGDATALTKVFGIGKKTAERVVVELRDKLASEVVLAPASVQGGDGEVIEALMALGYRAEEARSALKGVESSIIGVSARVAAALRLLGSKTAV